MRFSWKTEVGIKMPSTRRWRSSQHVLLFVRYGKGATENESKVQPAHLAPQFLARWHWRQRQCTLAAGQKQPDGIWATPALDSTPSSATAVCAPLNRGNWTM